MMLSLQQKKHCIFGELITPTISLFLHPLVYNEGKELAAFWK